MAVCGGILASGLVEEQNSTLYYRTGQEFLGFELCSILENSVPGSSSGNILRKGGKLETKGHGDKKKSKLFDQ